MLLLLLLLLFWFLFLFLFLFRQAHQIQPEWKAAAPAHQMSNTFLILFAQFDFDCARVEASHGQGLVKSTKTKSLTGSWASPNKAIKMK